LLLRSFSSIKGSSIKPVIYFSVISPVFYLRLVLPGETISSLTASSLLEDIVDYISVDASLEIDEVLHN
jgi:hypothetical protein